MQPQNPVSASPDLFRQRLCFGFGLSAGLALLVLLAGRHGLKESVPQAEGMAMDDEGTLYLISEPNLFYVFRKP